MSAADPVFSAAAAIVPAHPVITSAWPNASALPRGMPEALPMTAYRFTFLLADQHDPLLDLAHLDAVHATLPSFLFLFSGHDIVCCAALPSPIIQGRDANSKSTSALVIHKRRTNMCGRHVATSHATDVVCTRRYKYTRGLLPANSGTLLTSGGKLCH